MSDIAVCKDLKKSYGRKSVLKGLNLNIESGKIIGLLGPNGSGKTTLIKLMSGILRANDGEILIGGNPVGIETKKIVSYLPERPYFSASMKIDEVINFFDDFYEDFDKMRAYGMLEKLNISPDARIRTLSKGNREKVQLILVMSRKAKLYLLDEPMGGIDPAARDYILKTILTNYREDSSVIISTHLISDVENVLDDVVFIRDGEMVLHKSVDDIRMEEKKSVDALFREVFAC